jgi:ribosomal protein S18 acetylase RimI-like enzyme
MPRLRPFHNDDPPRLAAIWNDAFTGRGTYPLRSLVPLERCVFSKPYFDPAGLIVAEDGGDPVGFVHAGFGPGAGEAAIDPTQGVICLIAVRSSCRGRGIGAALLRAAEDYVAVRGTRRVQAGARWPRCPFYFGLYGGSNMPGFLDSDSATAPFLERHGYRAVVTTLVLQRRLDQPVAVADSRFAALRRNYEAQLLDEMSIGSWWQECVYGLLEPREIRLEVKRTGAFAGRILYWEMEGYSWRWDCPSVGVLDMQVSGEFRGQGLAKLLLTHLLRRLQDDYFGVVEAQVREEDAVAAALFGALGFERVDVGRVFEKQIAAE